LKLSIHDIDMAKNMADKYKNWSRRDFMKIPERRVLVLWFPRWSI
jgi:hypothetical protein